MRLLGDAARSVRSRGGGGWGASAALPSFQTPDTPAKRGRRRLPGLAVCIGATVVIAMLSVFGLSIGGNDGPANAPVLSVYVGGRVGRPGRWLKVAKTKPPFADPKAPLLRPLPSHRTPHSAHTGVCTVLMAPRRRACEAQHPRCQRPQLVALPVVSFPCCSPAPTGGPAGATPTPTPPHQGCECQRRWRGRPHGRQQ
jgi:hypothetical protein